jgi:hypothetical protein
MDPLRPVTETEVKGRLHGQERLVPTEQRRLPSRFMSRRRWLRLVSEMIWQHMYDDGECRLCL